MRNLGGENFRSLSRLPVSAAQPAEDSPESGNQRIELLHRGVLLLLQAGGLLARGLQLVFGAVQLFHKALGGVVALEGGQVFALARLVGGRPVAGLCQVASLCDRLVHDDGLA